MKNALLFFVFISVPFYMVGQETILDENRTRVDSAQVILRNFRNDINFKADNPNISGGSSESIYKKLFEDLSALGCPILFDTLTLAFFNSENLKPEKSVFKLNTSDFELLRLYLDSAENAYENRLFKIEFAQISNQNTANSYKQYLIKEYNNELKSVGRRMGRLIQSAIIEDDDYVTQNSYTRLDLAMANLKLVELELRAYLEKAAEKSSDAEKSIVIECHTEGVENLENQLLKARQETTPFFTATTDLDRSFGVGVYVPTKSILDVGGDLIFRFVPEGEFVIHPKIGMGRGLFHFALGGWWNIMQPDFEFTGNVYVIQKNIMGGVGFSKNRVMLTMGWNFQKD